MKHHLLTIALCLPGVAATADETEIGAHLDIELNAADQVESGCQLTFVAVNGHPQTIEKAIFETVLFDMGGKVERLTLLDFGTLPAGRPRVRQFVMPGLECNGLGRVLINGVHACEAPEIGPDACGEGLTLSTRADVELIG